MLISNHPKIYDNDYIIGNLEEREIEVYNMSNSHPRYEDLEGLYKNRSKLLKKIDKLQLTYFVEISDDFSDIENIIYGRTLSIKDDRPILGYYKFLQ